MSPSKHRRVVFTKEIIDDLRVVFASVCRDFEAELVEFDGEDDYVHLLVNYPPKVAVSALVNSLKGISLPVTAPLQPASEPKISALAARTFRIGTNADTE